MRSRVGVQRFKFRLWGSVSCCATILGLGGSQAFRGSASSGSDVHAIRGDPMPREIKGWGFGLIGLGFSIYSYTTKEDPTRDPFPECKEHP